KGSSATCAGLMASELKPSPSRGGLGGDGSPQRPPQSRPKPIPIPAFPLKGKSKAAPHRLAFRSAPHGAIPVTMRAMHRDPLTVLVAAFNEAQALPSLHPRIAAVLDGLAGDIDGRVLYVDDGSSDGTWDVLLGIANGDAR